jgi:hypothetical protein
MNPNIKELPENAEVRSHILPGDMDFVIRQDDNSFEKSYQLWFIIKYWPDNASSQDRLIKQFIIKSNLSKTWLWIERSSPTKPRLKSKIAGG